MKHVTLRAAFLDTLPVMTGYLFLGFGFGILMQQNGMGIAWGHHILYASGAIGFLSCGINPCRNENNVCNGRSLLVYL